MFDSRDIGHRVVVRRVPGQSRPARRDVAAVEWAADAGWPAPITGRLGEWRLRAAGGWTGRANSALAVGDPGLPLPEAVTAVERWYAGHGQTPLINVPLPYADRLDAHLEAIGWSHHPRTLVQTISLANLVAAVPAQPGLPPVTLSTAPSPGWLAITAGRKGALPAAALRILTGVDLLRFAEVYADGELLATGRGAVTAGWLGISLLEVLPHARRQGLARLVIGALARWAGEHGATGVYLQVVEHNSAATALYERLGFATHHHYLTRHPARTPAK